MELAYTHIGTNAFPEYFQAVAFTNDKGKAEKAAETDFVVTSESCTIEADIVGYQLTPESINVIYGKLGNE